MLHLRVPVLLDAAPSYPVSFRAVSVCSVYSLPRCAVLFWIMGRDLLLCCISLCSVVVLGFSICTAVYCCSLLGFVAFCTTLICRNMFCYVPLCCILLVLCFILRILSCVLLCCFCVNSVRFLTLLWWIFLWFARFYSILPSFVFHYVLVLFSRVCGVLCYVLLFSAWIGFVAVPSLFYCDLFCCVPLCRNAFCWILLCCIFVLCILLLSFALFCCALLSSTTLYSILLCSVLHCSALFWLLLYSALL
jgi:hypothetical protein